MSPANPLVSIVILSWNRRVDLATTLQEVRRQRYTPYEVIVVDNGSTDGSPTMVRESFPDVRLVALPTNVGVEGLNVGLRAANGALIVLLDDDSYPVPDALEALVGVFQRDPQLGVAACKILGPSGREDGWPWREISGGAEVPTFIGCGVGLRRAALDRAGLFDGAFFLYQNELDLAARIMEEGYAVRFFPEIQFVHAVSPSNRVSFRSDYYDTRNLLWIIWKYFPRAQALRLSLRVALERIGYRLLRGDLGRSWAVVRGIGGAFTARSTLLTSKVLSPKTRKQLLTFIEWWHPPLWPWLQARLHRRLYDEGR